MLDPNELQRGLEHHNAFRLDQAEAAYRRVLASEPANASALHLLGLIEHQRGRHLAGAELIRKAIAIEPRIPAFHSNLGEALRAADRDDEAIAAHLQALRLKPDFFEAINNLGGAFGQTNRVDDAIICYRRCLELRPDEVETHWNLAVALLVAGDLANGWREFEWRLRRPQTAGRTLPQPRWTGQQDIAGKTLLLWGEPGIGDTIQFLRFVPQIRAMGARVIVDVQRELVPLLATQGLADQVVTTGETPPLSFDFHAPMMSAPFILGTTLDTLPHNVPYLRPAADRIQEWAKRLPSDGTRKVGLAWSGRPTHHNDRRRSMAVGLLAPLAEVPGVTFVSVQPRRNDAPVPPLPLLDLGRELRDFADTAALVSQLDLVITVDTSVAHLAGALGRPVWSMLAFAPDWRWMLGRDDSPWYPTMRLFRQRAVGDWGDVVGRVRQALLDQASSPFSPP